MEWWEVNRLLLVLVLVLVLVLECPKERGPLSPRVSP